MTSAPCQACQTSLTVARRLDKARPFALRIAGDAMLMLLALSCLWLGWGAAVLVLVSVLSDERQKITCFRPLHESLVKWRTSTDSW